MKTKSRKRGPRADQLDALFTAAEYFENRGQLRLAFECLLAGARDGDQSCQHNLGNFYSTGIGVRRDMKKSAHWYRRAYDNLASHGVRSSGAAHNYALDLYRAGKIPQAIIWFEKARALKDASAMTWLAKIEIERHGVKGHKKAIRLLKQVLALEKYSEASELELEEAAEMLAKINASR